MLEEEFLAKILAGLWRERHFSRRPAEEFHPKLIAAVGKQYTADAPAHAVSDYHHWFEFRKLLLHFVKLFAKNRRGIGKGITSRVTVEPELVMLSDDRITSQLVNHRGPRSLGILQAMDHKHHGLVRIERLEPLDG